MQKFRLDRGLAIILAGGRSERLFPLNDPKPLLEIQGRSLLDHTLGRLKSGLKVQICCNRETATKIQSYRRKKNLSSLSFMIEPEPRDTAAAVGFCLRELSKTPPQWLAIFSADQFFPAAKNLKTFLNSLLNEINNHPEALFVAGTPSSQKASETHSQFGWIVPEKKLVKGSQPIRRFVEKPEGKILAQLRKDGGLINCGMFFGSYESFYSAYADLYPQVLQSKFPFSKLEKTPIDRAIFEKFKNTRVLRMPYQWEDLGTWENVARFEKTRAYFGDENSAFVYGDDERSIYVLGGAKVAVVNLNGKLVIVPLEKSNQMKTMLKQLRRFG